MGFDVRRGPEGPRRTLHSGARTGGVRSDPVVTKRGGS